MKKLLFALGVLVPFLLSAQQTPRSLTAANGTFIGFYEYKPPLYTQNTTRKFPLIIFLHGIGERGDGSSTLSAVLNVGIPHYINMGQTNMQFNYNGTTEGFLVLSPQLNINDNAYGGYWQPFYVDEMIKYATQNLRVDPARIYLVGLSLGGGGVWNYSTSSATAAKNLAAIVPICGTCEWSNACNIAQNALPVWAFHALDDGVVGVGCTQGAIGSINACSPIVAPLATYYPTGNHWIWDQVLDVNNPQVYLWLLSKSRGASAPPPTGGNVAPVANAGSAQTITLPTNSAALSGSGSYDQDGTITSYAWSQVSGPNTASFTSAWSSNTNVNGLVQGTYTFKLTATDNAGAAGTANVTVTVNGAAAPSNTPPVAVVSANQTITLPTNSVFLLGSGSYDAGGYITNYAWSQTSGPNTATTSVVSTTNLDVKNLVAGTYIFKLTVTDNGGATSSASVTVTVNGTTTPPPTGGGGGGAGAPIAVTSGNQTLTLPTNSAFLLGSGSYDVGGYITAYAWNQVSGPNTATITPMGSNLDVKNMVGGTYVFRLTVTDNSSLTGTADVTITVNGGTAPPPSGGGGTGAPIAVTSANQTLTLPTNSAFLLGSGSYDVGGWITAYAWSQVSGPNTATITPMGSNLDVKNMVAGTYTFKLTVTDNSGLTGTANVTVTVNGTTSTGGGTGGGAGAPVALAGNTQYITLPTSSVYLMGGGSYDVGGWINTFAWSQVSGPNTATLTTISSTNVEAKNLIAGTYTFKLTVTDNDGLTGSATMQVVVNGGTTSTAKTTSTTTETTLISSAVSTTSTNSLVLYPNPVTTTLNVQVSNDLTGSVTINVINSSGTAVKTVKATKSSTQFTYQVNVQDVPAGTYVVELIFSDGSRQTGQFVKA